MFGRRNLMTLLIISVIMFSGGCTAKSSSGVDTAPGLTDAAQDAGATDRRSRVQDASELADQEPAARSTNVPGNRTSTGQPAAASKERLAETLSGFAKSDTEERIADPVMVAKVGGGQKEHDTPRRQLANVYFRLDDWTIPPEGKQSLAETAEYLMKHRQAKLVIEGYCDDRGSREYNLVLGEKRALQTVRYLEALGLKNPTEITSYGKERPVCVENNEGCYWKNRRAQVVVIEEGN